MAKQKQIRNDGLSADWFLKGRMDPEYKQYVLLAYLKQTEKAFQNNKLYPHLSELVFHYRNLMSFLSDKQDLYEEFPQELTGVDLEKLKLYYRKVIADDELMKQLEDIVQDALTSIKPYLEEGKEIYDFVEEHMELKQVGLLSINPKNGYLFIRNGDQQVTYAYFYRVKTFHSAKENFKGITARYLASFKRTLTNTYESIKTELNRDYNAEPNPAGYAVETRFNFPENETLLPIAKRMLMRHLQSA